MKPNTVMVAPKGTITITTEEYAELIASKTILEIILAGKEVGGYCTDNVIDATRQAFLTPAANGEKEDA